tara:strand:- start:302 stop:703 length:402 start_codon:yes stop_codon:yes gene_type:complete
MEDEFFAALKLTTGEELIAKVCYMNEEDTLLVDNPMVVEKIVQKRGNVAVEGFHLKEWMTATYDSMFVIKMNQVVTITELDKKIEVFYLHHLKEDNNIPKTISNTDKGLTRQMGYLGSVQETKKILENIYNNS